MTDIVAALDATAAARPVLEAALGLAELTGTRVVAVHVPTGPVDTPEELARRSGVPLRLLEPPVGAALLDALAAPGVALAVIGSRTHPCDPRPAGSTALEVLEHAGKPVVVVPPSAAPGAARRFRRLLLPLEGTVETSESVIEHVLPLVVAPVELVVLHVFTTEATPPMLDQPGRDLELISEEFRIRFCPSAARIELRAGSVSGKVKEVCAESQADLIVLSWSQTMDAGRAAVVRDVLVHTEVPVLLVPVGDAAGSTPRAERADLDQGSSTPGRVVPTIV